MTFKLFNLQQQLATEKDKHALCIPREEVEQAQGCQERPQCAELYECLFCCTECWCGHACSTPIPGSCYGYLAEQLHPSVAIDTTQQRWKQDQNVKTKTETVRPRPRPIKLQQDYITEKLFCCKMHVCYQKITLCKKRQKVTWWPVTFGTVSALIARKNTGAYYTQCLVGHNSVGSKTKSTRPRLRPVWDRSFIRPQYQTPRLQHSSTNRSLNPYK